MEMLDLPGGVVDLGARALDKGTEALPFVVIALAAVLIWWSERGRRRLEERMNTIMDRLITEQSSTVRMLETMARQQEKNVETVRAWMETLRR